MELAGTGRVGHLAALRPAYRFARIELKMDELSVQNGLTLRCHVYEERENNPIRCIQMFTFCGTAWP